jgi:hypothetical protein
MEQLVSFLLTAAGFYIVCGLAFAVAFHLSGIHEIDEDVKGSTWGFRIIITPACILLWPLLLHKWLNVLKQKSND